MDATTAVSNNVKDGVLNVPAVSARSLGVEDPAPGQAKVLTITYTVNGGSVLTKTVNDNDSLYINAPPERAASGLQIVKADYGVQDNMTDVTSAVRNYLKNGSVNFVVGFKEVGLPDPNPAKRKQLVVEYTINGASNTQTLADGERFNVSAPATGARPETPSAVVGDIGSTIFYGFLNSIKFFIWAWSFFEGLKFGKSYGHYALWGGLSLLMPGFMFWGAPFIVMTIRAFSSSNIPIPTEVLTVPDVVM